MAEETKTKRTVKTQDYLVNVLYTLIVIGLVAIAFSSLRFVLNDHTKQNNFFDVLVFIGAGMLIAGASFASGGLVGFLFGIPKIVQNDLLSKDDTVKINQTLILHNDNLVEISDWLTKIIVGVGLTQLYKVPHFILKIGNELKPIFGNDESAKNAVIAVLLYFTTIGFLAIYIWTRLYFVRLLKSTDTELQEKLEKTQTELKEVKVDAAVKTNQLNAVTEEVKLKTEDLNAINNVYTAKPIGGSSYDDPQNGQWGGKSEVNGRKVTATVRESTLNSEWYNINLEVVSTDANSPLNGDVIFHLHPSMHPEIMVVTAENNNAQLSLVAWGAFTIGIECDNKATRLEINLADLVDAPTLFKQR